MIINAGNITSLYTAFSGAFNVGFMAAPSQWQKIAMRVPSSTRSETYAWLAAIPRIREWLGERIVNNLAVRGYAISNRKFENTVSVGRTEIEDDQYGVYSPVMQQMGSDAALHPDTLIFSLLAAGLSTLCFDGQNFFDVDHPVGLNGAPASASNLQAGGNGPLWFLLDCSKPIKPMIFQDRMPFNFTALNKETDENVFWRDEYVYGVRARCNVGYGLWQLAYASNMPLNGDTYAAARAAMQSLVADNGRPLGVSPTHLIVPPSLDRDARRLLVSGLTAQTVGGVTVAATNEWAASAELLMTPYLIPGA